MQDNLTQYTALRPRNSVFQPCIPCLSEGQINALLSSQICPQGEKKMSTQKPLPSSPAGSGGAAILALLDNMPIANYKPSNRVKHFTNISLISQHVCHPQKLLCLLVPPGHLCCTRIFSFCSPVFQSNLSSRQAVKHLTSKGLNIRFPLKTKKNLLNTLLSPLQQQPFLGR